MAKKGPAGFSWKETIPESNLYDAGYYNMDLETVEVDHTKSGLKQYRATCRITEPKDVRGQMYFARFVVGNEDDPDAGDPNTWKGFGAQRLRSFLAAVGAKDGHPDDIWPDLEGESVCAQLGKRTDNKKGSPYEGQEQQTDKWFKVGDREPGLIGQASTGSSRRKHEPDEDEEPAPARGRKPADDDEDEDEAPRRARR